MPKTMRVLTTVVVCVVLLVTLLLVRGRILRHHPRAVPVPPSEGASIYSSLRNHMLQFRPSPAPTGEQSQAWGVLMDMPVSENYATVVGITDGTASIYLSSGGGFLGGGQGHESISKAAKGMVAAGQEFRPLMHLTTEYALPPSGQITFYVVTAEGVFTASAPEAELQAGHHPLTRLYAAGQEVVTQYRRAGLMSN